MVFISNRSLKENVSQLDNEHMSPIWDEVELQNLIKHNQIKIQGSLEEYTRLLAAFSGGHPLVAIALARKAPSINLLVSNQLTKTPALEDEDLTVEVTNLLFNELLVDQDLRDFVLRISILVYPADILLLDFLSRKVSPALRTPSTLMTDRLKGTILEGDPKKGLQVAFVFRKVAADYISVDQRKEIFEHTSIFLLTPKNNVINADEAIQGIMYALLSHNLRRAFAWALMLLLEIPKLSNDQTTYLIDRLFFIEALKMPEAADVRIYYQITLLQIATGYSRIGKRKRCIEILNRILAHKVDISETPAALPIPIDQIYESFKMYLALELGLNQDFSHALQMLDQIDPRNLPLGDMDVNLIQVASDLVARGKPSEFPKNFLYRRVKTTTPAEDTVIGQLAVSFLKLGVLLSKEGSSVDLKKTLEVEDESPPVLWDLLSEMTRAQIELQRRNSEESIKILDGIMEKVSEAGIASNTLKAKVLIVKGDAFYLMHQDQNARVNYVKALKFLPGDQVLFDRAWANYRIGLCTTNAQEAISALSDASQQFNLLGYRYQAALSDGEKAVALYKAGKLYESVLEFEGLAKEYYLNGQMEYAPAVTIALALVGRIQSELEKKPVPTDASGKPIFPPFERGIFGKVAEHAKPNPGQCAAFYTLGEVYELLGKKDRKIEALKLSVSGSPKADLDVKVRVLAGLELIYELTLAGALEGVANAVKNLFHSTTGQEFRSEDFWVFATFTKIEVLLKEGRFHKEGYLKLLDVFEDATSCLSGKRKSWWLAEIYKRKAGIDSVTSPTELKPNYLIKALDHSQKSENYSVLLEVSQSMGYPSKPIARSIRELARIHSLIVLAICNDGGEIERLRSVGSNLVKIWPALEYRRLSEDDLPYWKNLRDRATEFEKKNVPPDLRPPLMVLLLLSVNTVKKNEKYKKAIDWAYATIGDKCGEIPQDVREYLDA
jgi:tetratricopeptide (TPR) repeat protein